MIVEATLLLLSPFARQQMYVVAKEEFDFIKREGCLVNNKSVPLGKVLRYSSSMRIEVDQSGHIETTRDNTALAFSNGEHHAILIPAKAARAALHELRRKKVKPPNLQIRLFSTALYLLLKEHITINSSILIDVEYDGLNKDIQRQLLRLLRQDGIYIEAEQIAFGHIGKKSPAHDLAIATYRKKRKPERTISVKEMLENL